MSRIRRMGEAYSSGDVTVTMAGIQDVNPSAVEYASEYTHEVNHGIRRKARSWRMGKEELTGKITLPLDVSAEFEKVAPKHNLAFIKPFVTVVVFTNSENEIITDVITWKFKGNKRSVTEDGELQNEFDMFVTDIEFNVGS